MSYSVTTTLNPDDPVYTQCFNISVGIEGGLSMDSTDRGNWTSGTVGVGELKGTKYGLSAMSWYGKTSTWPPTLEDAHTIYLPNYYEKVHCQSVPPPLACLMFDSSINNGAARPVPWMQQAAGATPDGVWGPETERKLAAYHGNGLALMVKYQAIRLRYMAGLSTWAHNTGWADRLFAVFAAAQGVK